MLGHIASPAMLARFAGSISLAAALERDPMAVLLSAPKQPEKTRSLTARGPSFCLGLPNFSSVSCVASTAEARSRSGQFFALTLAAPANLGGDGSVSVRFGSVCGLFPVFLRF